MFPECCLAGYPAEDLLFKAKFIEENRRALDRLAPHSRGITAVVGFVHREHDVFNAAAVPPPLTTAQGTATLTFRNCAQAELAYSFTGGSSAGRSGTIALSRVGPVPAGCVN